MKQTSLPFRIKGVFEGLAESNGLLILSGNELKIQIQTKDQLVGLIKTNVKEINIPLEQVEEVIFKKSIFGNKLTLRVADMNIVKDIPRQNSGVITASIDKTNLNAALDFASNVNLQVAELNLKQELASELNEDSAN